MRCEIVILHLVLHSFLCFRSSEGSWLVTTWTGSAGTSSDVVVVLCGREGESDPLPLSEVVSENQTVLQADQQDTFKVWLLAMEMVIHRHGGPVLITKIYENKYNFVIFWIRII